MLNPAISSHNCSYWNLVTTFSQSLLIHLNISHTIIFVTDNIRNHHSVIHSSSSSTFQLSYKLIWPSSPSCTCDSLFYHLFEDICFSSSADFKNWLFHSRISASNQRSILTSWEGTLFSAQLSMVVVLFIYLFFLLELLWTMKRKQTLARRHKY